MMNTTPKVTPATRAVIPPKRNVQLTYDFDSLTEVGMSFGVVGRTKRQLRTTISNANKKDKRVFYAKDVDSKTDPDGADCRVFRDTDKPTNP